MGNRLQGYRKSITALLTFGIGFYLLNHREDLPADPFGEWGITHYPEVYLAGIAFFLGRSAVERIVLAVIAYLFTMAGYWAAFFWHMANHSSV